MCSVEGWGANCERGRVLNGLNYFKLPAGVYLADDKDKGRWRRGINIKNFERIFPAGKTYVHNAECANNNSFFKLWDAVACASAPTPVTFVLFSLYLYAYWSVKKVCVLIFDFNII